jgi:hypothetical protein
MRLRFDRRVALLVLLLAGAAIVVTIATAGSGPSEDEAARRDLLALARAQERTPWLVEFRSVRELSDGRELPQRVTEANRPPVHVRAAGGTVTVDYGDRVDSCTTVDGKSQCLERDDDPSVATASVYANVARLGAYRIERAPDRAVAGETARCFRLVAVRRAWPQLGTRTEQCYAADGVPLWSRLDRAGARDTRTAVNVQRRVPAAVIEELLAQLEEDQASAAG